MTPLVLMVLLSEKRLEIAQEKQQNAANESMMRLQGRPKPGRADDLEPFTWVQGSRIEARSDCPD